MPSTTCARSICGAAQATTCFFNGSTESYHDLNGTWQSNALATADSSITCWDRTTDGICLGGSVNTDNALCDMSGNVNEWVLDWYSPYDAYTDYSGLPALYINPAVEWLSDCYAKCYGNSTCLGNCAYKVVRGGSYASDANTTRAAWRDNSHLPTSVSESVGFRCARGGFAATYTNASGQSVQAPPVTILRSDVTKLLGVQSARLVFLNRSNGKGVLSWIDYGEATPVVRSLPDVDPVFHPVISPDGNWVAWCTQMEGSTGTSRIKARRLAKNDTNVVDLGSGAIPRWWTSGTDTFLVWGTTAEDNTASNWGASRTSASR